ncbi:lasso peptide biosynthesis PqqD family chaperone [Goodfellowiella coeruleoviolacea]|uniref:Coenzyme PQQ synthesis protein D (PqqD) n=1 Tax=Goodfellowiella coeruleoviolacea TaxID=334858 RepID=A0AAE3KIV7_9PSEU|nr:lasso peptide biosynthesis PqqD family chaperone [Goodfellowiella coeruleoviolacea]MCP2168397.1 Coenzyme PQQ synthesis protein D (PqqD) [Goodfellowiella coeruleoviolacea]
MNLRLRPDVASTDTPDGTVLLDQRTGRYWQLNRTGAHVLRQLVAGHDVDGIAARLSARYGLDVGQVRRDVFDVADRLCAAGLAEVA